MYEPSEWANLSKEFEAAVKRSLKNNGFYPSIDEIWDEAIKEAAQKIVDHEEFKNGHKDDLLGAIIDALEDLKCHP